MFDQPVVVAKGGNSILDFLNEGLMKLSNNPVCFGAVNALQVLEDALANVVIMEMDAGERTGIELAEAIRDIDQERNYFTYIILVGPINHERNQLDDFHQMIDAVTGTKRVDVMEHLALAGARISKQINALRASNDSQQHLCDDLRTGQLMDPLTGLGNQKYAKQALSDTIRQVESRSGAACIVMIYVHNYEEVMATYDTTIAGELIANISERIQSLVRPLDVVTYFSPGLFALMLIQPNIKQCPAECYKRVFNGVRLKSYTTSAGFRPASIGMSICAATAYTGAPNADNMIKYATKELGESVRTESIKVHHIIPE